MLQAKGATVVATAGGSAKRSLLHSLGVQHVLSSRETGFASEAAQLGGVDVVLNSLTSAGMVAGSLAALNAGGRFVEISKRDIWSAGRVAQGEPLGGASRFPACFQWPPPAPPCLLVDLIGRHSAIQASCPFLRLLPLPCRAPRCALLAGCCRLPAASCH